MNQNGNPEKKSYTGRVIAAIVIILVIAGLVLGVDQLQRKATQQPVGTSTNFPTGSVPIYVNSNLVGGFAPADLEKLQMVSFVDAEEGKTQDGWLLKDVLLLYVQQGEFQPKTQITVSSSSRGKSAQLTWDEVENAENMVMLDLSNRGTVKLVSILPQLSTRDQWVQDVDKIEVITQ